VAIGVRRNGGDDFGEFFDPNDSLFKPILHNEYDLEVSATATQLFFKTVAPVPNDH
jgi:hypothetical protein